MPELAFRWLESGKSEAGVPLFLVYNLFHLPCIKRYLYQLSLLLNSLLGCSWLAVVIVPLSPGGREK